MASRPSASASPSAVTAPTRGPGAPNFNGNGGKMAPPWKPGQSGNPGGRPSTKPITEAYNRILDLPATALGKFTPRTQAEVVAWAMIRRAASMANKLGVAAAKEVTDRVEGGVSGTMKHQGDPDHPVRVRLEFTPRGAKTVVQQLPPGDNGHDIEGEPLAAYPVGPEEEEG